MTDEKNDFSHFGTNFQEELAYIILNDRPFADQMEEVLELSYFEKEYLRIFVKNIFNYRETYGQHPSYSRMEMVFKKDLEFENESDRELVWEYYHRLKDKTISDTQFIKDMSIDFCRKRRVYKAMIECVDHLGNLKFDEISTIMNDALKAGDDREYGHDYKKDVEERYEFKPRNPVETSWPIINEITQGGLGTGELGVVIAPTGAGKSFVLVNLGAAALRKGLNVLHYTLELEDKVVGRRYDASLSGIDLNQLVLQKEKVFEKVKDVDGTLIVKEYPTKSASVATIKKHMERMITLGVKPDLVLVDYADLLKPAKSYNQKRYELSDTYESLRGIAKEMDVPVWTASQTNRGGINADVIGMDSISEAFSKCFVADFIFSLSRNAEDKMKNTGRIYIAKNRNGIDGIVYPALVNHSIANIQVLDTAESPEVVTERAAKKQEAKFKSILSEKVNKIKNSN